MKQHQPIYRYLAGAALLLFQANFWGCSRDGEPVIARNMASSRAQTSTVSHRAPVRSIALGNTAPLLASAGADSTLIVWERPLLQSMQTIRVTSPVSALVSSGPREAWFYGDAAGEIVRWQPGGGETQRWLAHKGKIIALQQVPNRSTLISTGSDRKICLWNAASAELIDQLSVVSEINGLAVSPAGLYFAAAAGSQVIVWDIQTLQPIKKFSHGFRDDYGDWVSTQAGSVSFGNSDSLLISGAGNYLYIWDIRTGLRVNKLWSHWSDITCSAFSPDGQLLATGSMDKTIALWDIRKEKIMRRLYGHFHAVTAVAFSAGGDSLFAASCDHSISVWNVNTGEQLRVLGTAQSDPDKMWQMEVFSAWRSEYFDVGYRSYKPISSDYQILNVKLKLLNLTDAEMMFYSCNLRLINSTGSENICDGQVNYTSVSRGYFVHRVVPKSSVSGTFVFIVKRSEREVSIKYEGLAPVPIL